MDYDEMQARHAEMIQTERAREYRNGWRAEYINRVHRLHVGWTAARRTYLMGKNRQEELDALTSVRDFKKMMRETHILIMDKLK